jgi:hypothetical protein
MNPLFWLGAALAISLLASPALADPTAPATTGPPQMQPPMNSLDFAFYDCDGADVQVMYDSDTPSLATLVTSGGRKYELKRSPAEKGVQFVKGPVKFWTDRHSVEVEGTPIAIRNCKLKAR